MAPRPRSLSVYVAGAFYSEARMKLAYLILAIGLILLVALECKWYEWRERNGL